MNIRSTFHRLAIRHVLASFGVVVACAAQAQVITIDQARAMAGNVTPGDAPGFPVTLSQPGSYRLSGNLVVPAGQHGIQVQAREVSLDLAGFTISGPVSCDNPEGPLVCTASSARGVDIANTAAAAVTNGSIRGFGYGVHGLSGDANRGSRIGGLRISHIRYVGIQAGHAEVVGNQVHWVQGTGIEAGGVIRDNLVTQVRGTGIAAAHAAHVVGNSVMQVSHGRGIAHVGPAATFYANGNAIGAVFNQGPNIPGAVPLGSASTNWCHDVKC